MASVLSYRPSTNGTATSANTNLTRQASLSSFPSSRTPSIPSMRNGAPNPIIPRSIRQPSVSSSRTPSSTPSTQPFSQNTEQPPRAGGLKSQYPADSPERHVEYILVASFHVDRGPILEHQYPGAISGNENMLAELMLPDQAHVRRQDWTIFFLHKDTSEEEEKQAELDEERRKRQEGRSLDKEVGESDEETGPGEGTDEEEAKKHSEARETQEIEGGEGPPLIYVLNLVNTKQDTSAKRGAVVKAMAICTRHSFLHIYKPLLLLALEEYFKSPFPETLASLYEAVNSMDLSLMPRLSGLERHILQASDTKDLFVEKFEQMIQQRMAEESRSNSITSPDSPSKPSFEPARQGSRYTIPRDTHEFESRVVYNQIPIPIKVPTAISPETVGDFSIIKLIQIFSGPNTSSPQPFTLHSHLTTNGPYTHPIIILVNALLTQKRVIFLGHNRPSGEVAEAVLAACALASGGVLRGFTRHAFPYTDLTKIDDLLNVPGFVAGVTNPAFANHPEWWDVLCDVPTGRIKISSRIEPAPTTKGMVYFQQQHPSPAPSSMTGMAPSAPFLVYNVPNADPTHDTAFIEDLLRSIAARHGEAAIRAKWRDYITKFTRMAAAFEESVYGASALYAGASEADAGACGVHGHGYVWPSEEARARELGANVARIEGWRNTRSYYSFIQDLAALWGRRPIWKLDLAHQHDRLRYLKLSHEDSGRIYLALAQSVRSYDEVCQLLTVVPESHAGLFYVGLGLFHPDAHVRARTVELLDRIRTHEAGRHFWARMSRFAKAAFFRALRTEGLGPGAGAGAGDAGHEGDVGVGGGGGGEGRIRAGLGRPS